MYVAEVSGYYFLNPLLFIKTNEGFKDVFVPISNLNFDVRGSQSLGLQLHYLKAVENVRLNVNIGKKIGNFMTLRYHLMIR